MKVDIEALEGKIIQSIKVNNSAAYDHTVLFEFTDGSRYEMCHEQSCCENVWLEDFTGNPDELEGATILEAYESSNYTKDGQASDETHGEQQWTFYRINTSKGSLFFRWCGDAISNYTVEVDIYVLHDNTERIGFIFRDPAIVKADYISRAPQVELLVYQYSFVAPNQYLWFRSGIATNIKAFETGKPDVFLINNEEDWLNAPFRLRCQLMPVKFTYNNVIGKV